MSRDTVVILPILSEQSSVERILKPINHRSSLERTIEHAIKDIPLSRIIITTNDRNIEQKVESTWPDVILHKRKENNYIDALHTAYVDEGLDAKFIVILEPTHPFRPAGLVAKAINNLASRDHLDSITAVHSISGSLWGMDSYGKLVNINHDLIDNKMKDVSYMHEVRGLVLACKASVICSKQRCGEHVGFEVVEPIWAMADLHEADSIHIAAQLAPLLDSQK
jgi:hypothetical protein